MKKSFIVMMAVMLSLLLVVSASSATMKKGNWMLAGGTNAGFSSAGGDLNKIGDKSPTYITFNPSLGCFIMDGLAIGGTLQFSHAKLGDNKQTDWEVGPQAMYFFGANKKDIEKKMMVPFVGAGLLYGQSKTEYTSSLDLAKRAATVTSKYNMMHIHFQGGVNYMFTNSWAVFAAAFFEIQREKNASDGLTDAQKKWISGNEFGIQLGVSCFFGK